ncbi:MAG TPA: phosphoribosylamine--glycine ligase, partial [Thermomicrobiales bacterium]|nr:phosphoribosylamine--glycine ligase [Thermomicrobiales bacterium]
SAGALFAAPGNPGTDSLAAPVPIGATEVERLADWAGANRIDLAVVGPEAALERGLADLLQSRGIPVFGATRAAAELEWSKAFAKRFCDDLGMPTAAYAVFDEAAAALAHIAAAPLPLVVKLDGLAAGKGVWICQTRDEAEAAVRGALGEGANGAAGARVVIEEFLLGEEASVVALCDGERLAPLPPARDYKRLGDGDRGPNTGGMGAFAPVPEIDDIALADIARTILQPAIDGLRSMGRLYRGALYAGLMLTPAGPKLLEFNCRFGDPETQVMLPLLAGDFAQTLLDCANGRLAPDEVRWRPGAAACVVLAAPGYPARPDTGVAIDGIAAAEAAGATVLHAGTARRDRTLATAGGRVLSVVGEGATLAEARRVAYAGADRIRFPGRQLRRDIGVLQAAPA